MQARTCLATAVQGTWVASTADAHGVRCTLEGRPLNGAEVHAPRDYRQTSFWLASTDDDLTPRKPLSGNVAVDVAILGGGFSGLWTAYYLLRQHPGIEVAVLEKDICGFGASGRNGGWCSTRFPLDLGALEHRFGAVAARETALALAETVREIGRVVAEESIDAQYRETGILSVARGAAQLPAIQASLRSYERLGLAAHHRLLGPEETYELLHATKLSGALLTPHSASVHPGNLVRGLARAVERLGGVIYEQSEVAHIRPGEDAALMTSAGALQARRALVLAGEAYLSRLSNLRRALLPISSMIVLTEPLTQAQWELVGWQDGQSVSSQSNTTNYLTRTLDGRILYGSRGAPYLFGSGMSETALRNEALFEWMRSQLREWFPMLERVRFTHAWGGYVGMPRDMMPAVHFDPSTKLGMLLGYTGRGVSTSNLAARLLAGLIIDRRSGLEGLPLHRRASTRWEPEPLRWAAVRYVQGAYARMDAAEEGDRAAPWDARFARYLSAQ
jgi:glycine/D-amino acid oxidase-like deaminating enzyme